MKKVICFLVVFTVTVLPFVSSGAVNDVIDTETIEGLIRSTYGTYIMPDNLRDNMRIVYNRNGEAYVIFPYIQNYDVDEIYVKHLGVYIENTEKGAQITDINYVPYYFGILPETAGDEITPEEVQILAYNAFKMARFTKEGCHTFNRGDFDILSKREENDMNDYFKKMYLPCRGFERFEDWTELASGIFTNDKADKVFELSDKKHWTVKDGLVYLSLSVPQYIPLQFPLDNCRIVSNGNGKAVAVITLKYLHDPTYENVQILDLTAEFEKTEGGWRISGGEYFDYLFVDRSATNPETGDGADLTLIPFALMMLVILKRKSAILTRSYK